MLVKYQPVATPSTKYCDGAFLSRVIDFKSERPNVSGPSQKSSVSRGHWLAWLWSFVFVLLCTGTAKANTEWHGEFNVQKTDDEYTVEGTVTVRVPLSIAWVVATDYGNMVNFLPDLTESTILSRAGDQVTVRQLGASRIGPFRFEYDAVRSFELVPCTVIKSNGKSNRLSKLETVMQLGVSGEHTVMKYKATTTPKFWVPSVIGSYTIRSQTMRQFEHMAREMLRRAGIDDPKPKDSSICPKTATNPPTARP